MVVEDVKSWTDDKGNHVFWMGESVRDYLVDYGVMDWNTAHSISQRSNWGPRVRSIFYSFSIGEALDHHRRYWHYRLVT